MQNLHPSFTASIYSISNAQNITCYTLIYCDPQKLLIIAVLCCLSGVNYAQNQLEKQSYCLQVLHGQNCRRVKHWISGLPSWTAWLGIHPGSLQVHICTLHYQNHKFTYPRHIPKFALIISRDIIQPKWLGAGDNKALTCLNVRPVRDLSHRITWS